MGQLAKVLGGAVDIVQAFLPVDLQTAANNGDWVSLRNWNRVLFCAVTAIGTAGDDVTITLEQAKDNAGGSSKGVNFDTIYRKQAATDLTGVGTWTKTTQTAASTYTQTDAAEQSSLWVVEIKAEDLDVANDFLFVRGIMSDVGANAQLGYAFYILAEPAHAHAPENVLSPL